MFTWRVLALTAVALSVAAAGTAPKLRKPSTLSDQEAEEPVEGRQLGAAPPPPYNCSVYGWGRNKAAELLQPQGTESTAGIDLQNYMAG